MPTWPERPEIGDPVPTMWWGATCPDEAIPGVDYWNGRLIPPGDPQRTKEDAMRDDL